MFATVARVAGRRSVAFASVQMRVAAPVFRGMATMYFTPSHEYVCVDGDIATVGITDHAAGALGDVVYVELPGEGDAFEAGESFGSVESVKAASDIYLPVGGEVNILCLVYFVLCVPCSRPCVMSGLSNASLTPLQHFPHTHTRTHTHHRYWRPTPCWRTSPAPSTRRPLTTDGS
jgi:hypothetical protein